MNPPDPRFRHIEERDDGYTYVVTGGEVTLTFHFLKNALKWASPNLATLPERWGRTKGRHQFRVDID